MDNEIIDLYERLQSKYSLELTNSFKKGFKTNIDYPIIRGTSALGSFELFYGDLDFEFYAERGDGEFLSHRHLQSVKEAEQAVVDFMEGKIALISFGQLYDI